MDPRVCGGPRARGAGGRCCGGGQVGAGLGRRRQGCGAGDRVCRCRRSVRRGGPPGRSAHVRWVARDRGCRAVALALAAGRPDTGPGTVRPLGPAAPDADGAGPHHADTAAGRRAAGRLTGDAAVFAGAPNRPCRSSCEEHPGGRQWFGGHPDADPGPDGVRGRRDRLRRDRRVCRAAPPTGWTDAVPRASRAKGAEGAAWSGQEGHTSPTARPPVDPATWGGSRSWRSALTRTPRSGGSACRWSNIYSNHEARGPSARGRGQRFRRRACRPGLPGWR